MWGSLARGITATVRETASSAAESYVPGARDVLRRVGEVVAPPLHDGDEDGEYYEDDYVDDDDDDDEEDEEDEDEDEEGEYYVDESDEREGGSGMEFEDVIVDDDGDDSAVIVEKGGGGREGWMAPTMPERAEAKRAEATRGRNDAMG
jgi:hypothetical protein